MLVVSTGHLMFRMCLRHLLVKVWSLLVVVLVTPCLGSINKEDCLDVGIEYPDLVLKALEFQIGRSVLYTCLALFIQPDILI